MVKSRVRARKLHTMYLKKAIPFPLVAHLPNHKFDKGILPVPSLVVCGCLETAQNLIRSRTYCEESSWLQSSRLYTANIFTKDITICVCYN